MAAPLTEDTLLLHLENLKLGLEKNLASKSDVQDITIRLAAIDRGEFPVGFELRVKAIIETYLREKLTFAWGIRSNKASFAVVFVAVLALCVSSFAALHAG